MSQGEATLSSEEIKPVALELHLAEGISQLIENSVKSNFIATCTEMGLAMPNQCCQTGVKKM